MSHDPAPAPAAASSLDLPASLDVDDEDAPRIDEDAVSESAGPAPRSRSTSRRRRRKKDKKDRNAGLAKKLLFVTHLLKTLDLLVFAELSGLYYMECVVYPRAVTPYANCCRCSMWRFLLRAVGQYMYLTPKDESFPFLMPAGRVHALLVIVPNFICVLLHLFTALPRGPDFHRGYQHGGLIIDFVGQRPSTSRVYYLLADFAILVIQCLMLTVHTQREQLRVLLKTFKPLVPEIAQEMEAVRSAQDLDAEERGVAAAAGDDGEGVELREMNGEAESLLQDLDGSSNNASRPLLTDVMISGNAVLGEYFIVQSVLAAASDFERTAAHSLRTISYGATLAASLQARRRAAVVRAASIANNG